MQRTRRPLLRVSFDYESSLDIARASRVTIRRARTGDQKEIETLINEEASLFAQYLRKERQNWNPHFSLLGLGWDKTLPPKPEYSSRL